MLQECHLNKEHEIVVLKTAITDKITVSKQSNKM